LLAWWPGRWCARARVFLGGCGSLADVLGPAARRDLLRVLTSQRGPRRRHPAGPREADGQELADLLVFLEEWALGGRIEELSRA